jgi:hypothetical protein
MLAVADGCGHRRFLQLCARNKSGAETVEDHQLSL